MPKYMITLTRTEVVTGVIETESGDPRELSQASIAGWVAGQRDDNNAPKATRWVFDAANELNEETAK